MPLPKNYYDLISQEKDVTSPSDPYGIYEQWDTEPEREPGTMYDALGATLWGAASGLTWGVSEYFRPYGESWEQMSDYE